MAETCESYATAVTKWAHSLYESDWAERALNLVKAGFERASRIHWSVHVLVGISAASAVLYATSPFVRRGILLYRYMLPATLRYRFNEMLVKRGYYKDEEAENESWHKLHREYAPQALKVCLELQGIYLKFGQVYGSRTDFVPPEYQKELSTLVDSVPPRPITTMQPKFETDLGRPCIELFSSIDETPLGAASIGQVHRAVLRDGTVCVIKSSYPGCEELTMGDITALYGITRIMSPELTEFFDEFMRQVGHEFNFEREAENQRRMYAALADEFPDFVVPLPFDDLVSRGTMVMEYLNGIPLIAGMQARPDIAGHVVTRIVQALGKTILIDGFFHGDPHPGNVLLLADGKIGLVDFGNAKELPDVDRKNAARLFVTMAGGDDAAVAKAMRDAGFRCKHNRDSTLAFQAKFSFDSLPIPDILSTYMKVVDEDPFTKVPADWPFLVRVGIMMRGLVSLTGLTDLSVLQLWLPYARRALADEH